jgi:hypothetical protein
MRGIYPAVSKLVAFIGNEVGQHLYIVLRLRIFGAIPPLPHISSWWRLLHFTFTITGLLLVYQIQQLWWIYLVLWSIQHVLYSFKQMFLPTFTKVWGISGVLCTYVTTSATKELSSYFLLHVYNAELKPDSRPVSVCAFILCVVNICTALVWTRDWIVDRTRKCWQMCMHVWLIYLCSDGVMM